MDINGILRLIVTKHASVFRIRSETIQITPFVISGYEIACIGRGKI